MKNMLLVEDHIEFAQVLTAFLKKKGFSLFHVESAEAALSWLSLHQVDLILLDIMLPGMDGFAFMRKIRQSKDIPILIMSARGGKDDQLLGFDLGADDYIQKPVDPDILCAKIQVLLHHFYGYGKQHQLQSGELFIDLDAHKVYLKQKQLDLNAKEFELLLLFVKNEGKTLQKEFLFHEIWGPYSESENQTLTVHIKMLRSKIEETPRQPKRIQTVWGVGYRYEKV